MCKVLWGGIHKQVMQRSQLTKKPRIWCDCGSNDKGPQHVSYTSVRTENCTLYYYYYYLQHIKLKGKGSPVHISNTFTMIAGIRQSSQIDHTFFILQQSPICFVNIQAAVSLVSTDPLLSWLGVHSPCKLSPFFQTLFWGGSCISQLDHWGCSKTSLDCNLTLKEINIFGKLKWGGGVSIFVLPLFFN